MDGPFTPWIRPKMSPLPFPQMQPHCPIQVLPEPCRSAAIYAITKKKIPPALALTDALGAIAAVIHCGYDCEAPDGDRIPATINTCVVAPSRAGKGASMRVFFRLFREAGLRRAHAQVAGETHPDGHAAQVNFTKFISGKITYVSLVEQLAGYGKNLTIQREEGRSFLLSDFFKDDADALTTLWSGYPQLDRTVRGKEVSADEARCSVGFRIQPVFMEEYLLKRGKLSYKLGFWPRAIAGCYDPKRFPFNSIFQVTSGDVCSPDRFQRQMENIAARLDRRKFQHRVLVKLSIEAKAFMLELQHIIKEWGSDHYSEIEEAVGCAWENTLRVATVLHVFCIGHGEVSRDFTERAWKIIQWSLYQHQLIFVESLRASSPQVSQGFTEGPSHKPYRLPKAAKTPRPMENVQFVLECLHTLFDSDPSLMAVPLEDVRVLSGLNTRLFETAVAWLQMDNQVRRFEDRGRNYILFHENYVDRRYFGTI